jgi:hypothetical protein
MCVLTMPGITYLPVASITASAGRATDSPGEPMDAILPSSMTMSAGPYGGLRLP